LAGEQDFIELAALSKGLDEAQRRLERALATANEIEAAQTRQQQRVSRRTARATAPRQVRTRPGGPVLLGEAAEEAAVARHVEVGQAAERRGSRERLSVLGRIRQAEQAIAQDRFRNLLGYQQMLRRTVGIPGLVGLQGVTAGGVYMPPRRGGFDAIEMARRRREMEEFQRSLARQRQLPPPRPQLALPPGGGGGGRPPLMLGPGAGGGDEGFRRQAAGAKAAADATATYNSRLDYHARALGMASTAMRRHGALTTEFIEAAAKGQVTMRELGFQIGATVGKFAGWVTAAVAVYGVASAIGAVGRGAIQAADGVSLLNRVTTTQLPGGADELQKRFSQLSRQFNLPVNQVVDATYGMAKAFQGDLPRALQATEAALFAVKVGELDTGQATQDLNAIVAGFRLEASQLMDVMDAVNQVTNRFGGNAGDLTSGIAKAGGAFKQAGGEFEELLALLQTGRRLTGRTAVEIATAVSRSASITATPGGAKRLRAAGLDPLLEYPQLLEQAFAAARGASRERVEEIARAMVPAGGQFARIFVPILRNQELYNKVLAETTPEKRKGSAQRELAIALAAPGEQLKRLVGDLERLGIALAQAGALDPLIGLVKGLDFALNLAQELLSVFEVLPRPLRSVLVTALELAAVLRLMRRFDLGASLPQGRAGTPYAAFRERLRRPEGARTRAQVLQGLGDERRFYEDLRQQRARDAAMAGYDADITRRQLRRARRFGGEEDIERAREAHIANLQRERDMARQRDDLSRRGLRVEQQTMRFEAGRYRTREEALRAAHRAGIRWYPSTLNRPAGGGPLATAPGARMGPEGPRVPYLPIFMQRENPQAAAAAAARLAGTYREQTVAQQRLARMQAALNSAIARSGVIGRSLGGAVAIGAGVAGTAARGTAALASGFASFGRALLASLGPLDVLFVAIGTFLAAKSSIDKRLRQEEDRVALLSRPTPDPEAIRARAREELERKPSLLDRLRSGLLEPITPIGLGLRALGAKPPREREMEEAEKALGVTAPLLERAQARRRLLPLAKIRDDLKRRVTAARDGGEELAAIEAALTELESSFAATHGGKEAKQKMREMRAEVEARRRDLLAAMGDMNRLQASISAVRDLPGVQRLGQEVQTRFGRYGGRRGGYRAAAMAATQIRELIANRTLQGEEVGEALQVLDQIQSQVQQQAQEEMNRLLPYARSPREQRQIRRTYLARMREQLTGSTRRRMRDLTAAIRRDQAEMRELERASLPDRAEMGPHDPDRAAPRTAVQARRQERIRVLRQRIARNRRTRGDMAKQLKDEQEELRALEREQQRAQFEAEQQLYEAYSQLGAARIADPVARARYLLGRANARLADIAREYGRQSTEYVRALADAAQQRQQLVEQEFSRFQSQVGLRTAWANIGATQEQQLRRAVSDAQTILSRARQTGNLDLVIQASTQLAQARAALVDFLRQQAEDLVHARAEYQASRTEDPIRLALIRFREAQQAMRFARTPAERLRARARVNETRREVRNTRQQEAFEQIQFDAEMGRIDRATQIARLRALVRQMRGNRELRRQIQRTIKQLENESDSLTDLDVGNIRLPTLYEIRRAVQGGLNVPRAVNVTNSPTIHIDVRSETDALRVGDVIDRTLATSTRAAMRAQGVTA
jgi:hypothetical protein